VLMKRFGAEDIWQDVSMREYDVLYTLSKCREPIRISELNRHVLLSQPALSRLVQRLSRRGMIASASDAADGRGVRVSLTDAGRVLQRRIGRQHARDVAHTMTAALSRDEIRELEATCLKLARQADPALPTDMKGRRS
jgi:DNA-binding MarR family transcriptional regulator